MPLVGQAVPPASGLQPAVRLRRNLKPPPESLLKMLSECLQRRPGAGIALCFPQIPIWLIKWKGSEAQFSSRTTGRWSRSRLIFKKKRISRDIRIYYTLIGSREWWQDEAAV
jgi:hypothetical protein